eukprot:CAMPEP_0201524372 /NCGR_PEP_ID=MMETSP0161_2-20130828/21281_1 /ASSEMBLY_ACC=CAM_ASM_000251 /TAXON_ID=180227 /ORGANISM="Neoparamoeba aestuarina, Strain SoJaBio B1-5/56/2" /LENGTH=471 /DNA_ID=CAMNT_0047923713 /DNA_START=1 /DNA_END=1413 /DNA_ORIENTATION=+
MRVGDRDLLSINTDPSHNCVNNSLPDEFRETYGRGIFPLLCIYICCGLGIICEAGFQDSLYCISEILELSPDVAGATFMAAGTSAPELFISLLALNEPDDAMGMGTIVGSVVFNILIIIGLCALFAPTQVQLQWRVLLRDSFWNIVAFIYLFGVFFDQQIVPFEAAIGLMLYVVYVAVMVNSEKLVNLFRPVFESCGLDPHYNWFFGTENREYEILGEEDDVVAHEDDDYFPYTTDDGSAQDLGMAKLKFDGEKRNSPTFFGESSYHSYNEEMDYNTPIPTLEQTNNHSDDGEPPYHFHEGYLVLPAEPLFKAYFFLTIPFRVLFAITVPPVRQFGKYTFVMTFCMSVMWLAILSYFLILWVSEFGCSIHLGTEDGDAIMGLTFLAVGTSMPDCLTSIFVAMGGRVEMAVCNALGSNMFDILLALSLPWCLKLAVSPNPSLKVDNATLQRDISIMFLVVFWFFGLLAFFKW